jgi:hypothetical protein
LNQQVKVVKGKHKGKKGEVFFYHPEGDGGRITLLLDNGSYIFVDKDEIDFKFEGVYIDVMMDEEEERAYLKEIARAYRDGETTS